jgi:hypothetical protein
VLLFNFGLISLLNVMFSDEIIIHWAICNYLYSPYLVQNVCTITSLKQQGLRNTWPEWQGSRRAVPGTVVEISRATKLEVSEKARASIRNHGARSGLFGNCHKASPGVEGFADDVIISSLPQANTRYT